MRKNFIPIKPGNGNKYYLQNLQTSKEWEDLDILLSVLQELDAAPLIISRPVNGPLLQATKGISAEARQEYYNRLEQVVVSTFFTFQLVCFGLLIFSGRLG